MTDATPRVFQTSGKVWLKDFEFGLTGLKVRKTGALVPYSPSVIAQVTAWFRYFFAAQRIERMQPHFKITFSPERARPWYLIWAVSRAAGAKYVKDAADADVVMHFEDATYSPNDPPTKLKPGAKLVNFTCRDVSKTNVARACKAAFGNVLAVDPVTFTGLAVEKSEINAAHDGRIVQCGAPYNVYNAPVDRAAAAFFSDINVIRGTSRGALTATPFGDFLTPGHRDGAEVEIVIRPQHLRIDFDRGGRGPNPTPEDGTPARGTVLRSRYLGRESLVDFAMDFEGAKLTASVPGVFLPKPGTVLWLMIRRERCFVFGV